MTSQPKLYHDAAINTYDIRGIQKCSALFTDDPTWRNGFDNDALSTMDQAILGLRFKQWKPVGTDNPSFDDKINSYCYLYNNNTTVSSNKGNIQDPFLKTMKCSAADIQSIGPGKEFITNIFSDNAPEHSHAGRFDYNKCIFEINKNKITSSNLAGFWKTFAENECNGYKENAQDILSTITGTYTSCNAQLTRMKSENENIHRDFDNLQSFWPKFKTCKEEQQSVLNQLGNLAVAQSNIDCGFWGKQITNNKCSLVDKAKKQQLESKVKLQTITKDGLQAEQKALTKRLGDLTSTYNVLQQRSNVLSYQIESLNKEFSLCKEDVLPSVHSRIALVSIRLRDLLTNLKTSQESAIQLNTNRARLDKEYQGLVSKQQMLEQSITTIKNEMIICTTQIERNQALAKINREDSLRYESQQQVCDTELQQAMYRLEQLKQTTLSLTTERDQLLALCRKDQQQFYNATTGRIATEVNAAKQQSLDACADTKSADIASKVQQLLQEKERLQQQLASLQNGVLVDVAWCKNPENKPQWDKCCLALDANTPIPMEPE